MTAAQLAGTVGAVVLLVVERLLSRYLPPSPAPLPPSPVPSVGEVEHACTEALELIWQGDRPDVPGAVAALRRVVTPLA